MRTTSRFASTALLASGLALVAAPTAAFADPGGNNGTVKISEVAVDSVPQNDPHVGCQLHVQWYGFDLGAISQVSFQLVSPTQGTVTVDGPLTVNVGADHAGGGKDPDGDVIYTMHPVAIPQPQQGFHEKITVNTTYAHGSTKKSKVIWFKGCVGVPAVVPSDSPSVTPSTPPAGQPAAQASPPPSAPSQVAGTSLVVVPLTAVTAKHVPTRTVKVPKVVTSGLAEKPGQGGRDGGDTLLLGAGVATVAAGLTLLGLGRRTTRRR